METQDTIKDKASRKLESWKSQVEHLNVQMHLGSLEAKEEFEKQKKALGTWTRSLEEDLSKVKGAGEEKLKDLRATLEGLRVQAAIGKVETEDKLKEQQKNLSATLHTAQEQLSNLYSASTEKAAEVSEEAGHKLEDFKTRFDLLKLQLHLGKAETKDLWTEKKKELSIKLKALDDELEKGAHVASEKWEGFSTEIGEAWKHFKSAFKS